MSRCVESIFRCGSVDSLSRVVTAAVSCRCQPSDTHFCVLIGGRSVLNTSRYHTLRRPKAQYAVSKLDTHAAFPNEKHFVFLVMSMPQKRSLKFHQLDSWLFNSATIFGLQYSLILENFSVRLIGFIFSRCLRVQSFRHDKIHCGSPSFRFAIRLAICTSKS